jgi:hypothetical protein
MRDSEIRCLEMFQRVIAYVNGESTRFASNPYVTSLSDELESVAAELRAHADAQSTAGSAARQLTQTKAGAHEEVFDILSAMRRTARSIPGQEEKFNFSREPKEQQLLSMARTFAAAALPIKAEFITRGMRIDFLEVLTAAADALEQALSHRAEKTQAQVDATASIDDLRDAGMQRVRQLDTVMRNTFADDPGKLAAWISASHVERPARRSKPAPESAPPAAPAA